MVAQVYGQREGVRERGAAGHVDKLDAQNFRCRLLGQELWIGCGGGGVHAHTLAPIKPTVTATQFVLVGKAAWG